MANFVQDYIKSNKSHIEDYKDYLEGKDWSMTREIEYAKKEYSIQSTIVKSVITDLKYFVKKAEAVLEHKYVIDFIELMTSTIDIFNRRCEVYMSVNDWTTEQDDDKKNKLLQFFDKLRREITDNTDDVIALNLDFDVNNLGIKIHGDKKIPFLFRDMMEEMFPQLIEAKDEYHNIE